MTKSPNPAFVHPIVDCGVVGAFALPLLFAIRFLDLPFGVLAIELCSLGIITPHYLPTIYRLYGRRESIITHRDCAIWAPILICAALSLAAIRISFFTHWFVTLYGVWRLYHYAAQAYGVAVLYAARSGQPFAPITRVSLQLLLYGSAYWCLFSDPHFFTAPSLLPYRFPDSWRWPAALPLGVIFIGFGWSLRGWRGPLAGLALIASPILTHFFFLHQTPRAVAAMSLAGVFHSSQYLFITRQLALREAAQGEWPDATFFGRMNHSKYWWGWVLLGGILLFAVLKLISFVLRRAGVPAEYAFILPVMALNFHHFLSDGVLWRLSRRPELGLLRAAPLPSA